MEHYGCGQFSTISLVNSGHSIPDGAMLEEKPKGELPELAFCIDYLSSVFHVSLFVILLKTEDFQKSGKTCSLEIA